MAKRLKQEVYNFLIFRIKIMIYPYCDIDPYT